MPRQRTWKILDRGKVAINAPVISYGGPCGHEAALPVNGTVIAETSGGNLIFDGMPRDIPVIIHCRQCRCTYTTEPEKD